MKAIIIITGILVAVQLALSLAGFAISVFINGVGDALSGVLH